MAQGIFKEADPAETAILLRAEAHGLSTLFRMHRRGHDDEMFQDIDERCIAQISDGLRAGSSC